MAITFAPEVEETSLPTETRPQRQTGGWSIQPQPRVGLNLGSDDELLMVENKTGITWFIYHNYHQLGIIDAGELLLFHLYKHGSLSVRPRLEGDAVEYLLLPLNYNVNYVNIVRRTMGKELEVYDLRVV